MRLKLTAATMQTNCNRNGRAHGDVVAICLEHDIVTQGVDQHDAILSLEACLSAWVHVAEREGRDPIVALGGPPPADALVEFTGPRVPFEFDTDDWSWSEA